MSGKSRLSGLDPVDQWLTENEWSTRSGGRAGEPLVPFETVAGVLFGVWGALLLMVFTLDVVWGGFAALFFPGIRGFWGASLALAATGGWLAFELSNTEGFEVAREPIFPSV
jgi:hypothetical protein